MMTLAVLAYILQYWLHAAGVDRGIANVLCFLIALVSVTVFCIRQHPRQRFLHWAGVIALSSFVVFYVLFSFAAMLSDFSHSGHSELELATWSLWAALMASALAVLVVYLLNTSRAGYHGILCGVVFSLLIGRSWVLLFTPLSEMARTGTIIKSLITPLILGLFIGLDFRKLFEPTTIIRRRSITLGIILLFVVSGIAYQVVDISQDRYNTYNVQELVDVNNGRGLLAKLQHREPYPMGVARVIAAITHTVPLTRDQYPNESYDAAGALGEIQYRPAVPYLIKALHSKDEQLEATAAEALGAIGDKRAQLPLIGTLKSSYEYSQAAAARSLGNLLSEDDVPRLIDYIKRGHSVLQSEAALRLGRIGDRRAVPVLISALKSPDYYVQEEAVVALDEIGDPKALPALKMAAKSDEDLAYYANIAIRNIRKKSRKESPDETSDPKLQVHDREVRQALIRTLRTGNGEVRSAAAGSLGVLAWIGDDEVVTALITALANPGARLAAADALGNIGDEQAIIPLIKALRSDDVDYSMQAARSLGRIGDPRALPALKSASSHGGNLGSTADWAIAEIEEKAARKAGKPYKNPYAD